jgi:hypothetical protein
MLHVKAAVVVAAMLPVFVGSISCGSTSGSNESGAAGSRAQTTRGAPQTPPTLDGQQEYRSAQQIADDLNARGRQCEMTSSGGGEYTIDSGRCYLGGSAGPEIVLSVYSSQPQIDNYLAFIIPKLDSYGYLLGKNWTSTCDTRALCDDLHAVLGGVINASANLPPGEPVPTAAVPINEEVADSAQRWILESFGQFADSGGSFKNIPCPPEDPEMMQYCWMPYINNFTFSDGILLVHMRTDWTQQPDAARMVATQNKIRNILQNGPGPKIVMDNVRAVQSVDRNGVTRSDAPLPG